MATTIKIGKAQIRDEDYAIQANAILGIRGTGKTTLAKSIAEQMLQQNIPIIVFDPTGVWRYLKRGAKKGQRGYKVVVAGGVEPDLQLTPSTAAEIVRAAIKENVSLVIDLYDRKLSKADWRRIVRDCFRTLMYENEGVRHIFLEEAAEFAPQRVGAAEGEVYAEVEKVVRMGGNASLGITLINQRSQEVNKAVLELCENLVLMKQRGSHAIDAIEKWIDKLDPEYAAKIKGDLPNLGAGECFVFRGDGGLPLKTHGNALATFHPDRRRPEAIKRAGTSPDVAKFVAALGERLKDKTALDTLESLRARIKTLEKGKPVSAVKDDSAKLYKDEALMLRKKIQEWEKYAHRENKRFKEIAAIAMFVSTPPMAPSTETMEITIDPSRQLSIRLNPLKIGKSFGHAKPKPEGEVIGELTGPQRALLKSLYWLRDEPITLAKAAFYGGYKPGRYSADRIGELRTARLVQAKSFQVTEAGMQMIAGTAGEKPTGQHLRQTVRGMLTGPQNKILDALLESAGPMSLAEISEATGYEVGRYLADRVGELRTLELVLGNDKTGGAQPSPFFRE